MRLPMPDCLLPLSISSEGSAQIGGVLATNAGGNNTVRYGNARDLVLGLEVVLPDGQVWNGLRRLHKDNTGYCLRQLFVGSEGTLGIITAAVLKLYPRPRETAVALCAVALARGGARPVQPAAAARCRRRSRPSSTCRRSGSSWCCGTFPARRCRCRDPAPAYVLVELATPREGADLRGSLEAVLARRWRPGSSPTR